MFIKATALCGLLLVLSPQVMAGEKPGVLHRISCTVVRYYVGKYSASAAQKWARSHGATAAEIKAARRCLKGGPAGAVQTAHLAGH
ncbi:MAG: hypothetical protein ACREDC_06470 [Bradyrhizobium sp.]